MKEKVKRKSICLPHETDELLIRLSKETGLKFSTIIKQGIELFAKTK